MFCTVAFSLLLINPKRVILWLSRAMAAFMKMWLLINFKEQGSCDMV